MEVSSYFNMKVASCVVDWFEDAMDVFMNCSHSVELFFYSATGEFIVVIEVHGTWIKAIENSVGGEFVRSGGYSTIGKFRRR